MPNSDSGRHKIKAFMDKNNISVTDMATKYGIQRSELSAILSGERDNPKAHMVIVKIISDYQIR